MAHHTKDKGDFATIKAIADLSQKGFDILTPLVCEHLPFDIVGYKDGRLLKFQSKYSCDGFIKGKTSWSDKNGSHVHKYSKTDFDYYTIYLPDKDVVCYPSIAFSGCTLATKVPNSPTPFYWYEDFLDLTDVASKKTYRDFGYELTRPSITRARANTSENTKVNTKQTESVRVNTREKYRKVVRPSKEELEQLLWQFPMTALSGRFGVSDKAIAKWAKSYGITTPALGYWIKKET